MKNAIELTLLDHCGGLAVMTGSKTLGSRIQMHDLTSSC
jgi:hypothetical protein